MMAFLVGLTVGASFGPVNLLLTNQALTYGTRTAVQFAAGAVAGDLSLVIAGLVAGKQIVSYLIRSGYLPGTLIAFGMGLALMASGGLWRCLRPGKVAEEQHEPTKRFLFAMLVTALNPLGALLWLTAVSILIASSRRLGVADQINDALSMLGGDASWFIVWTSVLCVFHRLLKPKYVRFLGAAAYVGLFVFASLTIVNGAERLMHVNGT